MKVQLVNNKEQVALIKEKLKDFTVIKFQAEDLKNAGIAGILKHYNIQGLPSFVILERK